MSAIVGLENGVASYKRGEELFFLEFLSPTALHIYKENRGESYAVANRPAPVLDVRRGEEDGENAFFSGDLAVHIHHTGLISVRYKNVAVFRENPWEKKDDTYRTGIAIQNDRPVYGLGDKPGPLDKRGYDFINWNTDDPTPHIDHYKSLYKSIPFFVLFGENASIGVFVDNTYRAHFDFNKQNSGEVRVDLSDGDLDFYLFFGSLPNVVAEYTRLVGGNSLPPRWVLGAQQSRWSYARKEDAEAVIEGYEKADIPLSAIYLDIDYMDAFKDFTVDGGRYPKIGEWVASLKEKGIHVVPIIDAGVKAEEGYFLYDEGLQINAFSKDHEGNVYHNEVWPGDSVFPSFASPITRVWWSEHVSDFLDLGFGGIWNDMNEPASFNGPLPENVDMGGKLHSEIHNVYAHFMDEATSLGFLKAGKRPFVLSRAAYAGTAKYAGIWTGDNHSAYEHVRLMLPQLSGLALSGFSLTGADIGGFNGDATGELLIRFAQAALFNPIFRNHSACDTRSQEPFAFDEETTRRYREVVLTRYEIIPYLYDLLFLHERTGVMAIRPLVCNFPKDQAVWNENTEIMLGDSLLLAPALFPGQNKRSVYFPCNFFHYSTGKMYGPGYHVIDCGLDDLPLFVREGSLVPLASKGNRSTEFGKELRLLWTGGKAFAYHYEDAGDGLAYKNGEYNLYLFEVDEEGKLEITAVHEGYIGHYEKIFIERLGEAIDD